MVRCVNCFGTGTVFPGKTLKTKSKKCPVCKGATKIPAPTPEQTPTPLHGAQRSV